MIGVVGGGDCAGNTDRRPLATRAANGPSLPAPEIPRIPPANHATASRSIKSRENRSEVAASIGRLIGTGRGSDDCFSNALMLSIVAGSMLCAIFGFNSVVGDFNPVPGNGSKTVAGRGDAPSSVPEFSNQGTGTC